VPPAETAPDEQADGGGGEKDNASGLQPGHVTVGPGFRLADFVRGYQSIVHRCCFARRGIGQETPLEVTAKPAFPA
jgi:hypothetical protein